jgi:salicylate hydroxylase
MISGRGRNLPVLIAGGGIGGFSAAIALAQHQIASHILEAEPDFSESGAGIQIGPNGSRILRSWGLEPALDASAARPDRILIGDGRFDQSLASIPLGHEAEARYGAPYFVLERRRLHRLLAEDARQRAGIELSTGFRVLSFRHTSDGISVMSEDGREQEGCALIGADGVHSRIRKLLFGAAPVFSGHNAWRSTAPAGEAIAQAGSAVHLWLGRRAHLVHYACNADGLVNAVAITSGKPASPGWGAPGALHDLLPAFAAWADAPWNVLKHFDRWTCWPLLTMRPLRRWTDGRIALLGDAAHPLMPFLASGAVMAIEDAAVLAGKLARKPMDPQIAFKNYEKLRIPRVRRVQHRSQAMGGVYHLGGAMRLARNLTFGLLPPNRLLARNDWLYGYCAEG